MAAALLPDPLWDRYASYCAREWVRSLAVGRGTDVCVAQSVPTLARPLRQAGRHRRGVPLARVRPDLLAIAAQDMENRLRPMPSFPGVHRRGRCFSAKIKSCGLLREAHPVARPKSLRA